MGNEMSFGIYHTDCRKNVERFKQLVSSDFINTFLIEGDIDDEYFSMNFELSKEYPEKNFWISVGKLGFYHEKMKVADVGEKAHVPKTCFYEDFEDRVN